MSRRVLSTLEISFIILLACVPLFATFPYRVNIFLSWEGAYRISEGQLPFRDFGTPLGGMFWVIPGLFFKIFGPQMLSLVKAQVFINIVSGLAFRSILKSLSVDPGVRLLSIIVFVLSFSFMNFWPWYNHSVIVYELIALACLFKYLVPPQMPGRNKIWLISSACFIILSFFTKQDGGGMAFMLCLILLLIDSVYNKKWSGMIWFLTVFTFLIILVIVWLNQFEFEYWFNHGQSPHSARISPGEIINDFFNASHWIKFYMFLIALLMICNYKTWKLFWSDNKLVLFLSLTIMILGEAAIFQVTSYTPPDNNIFFHSFAIALILTLLGNLATINFLDRKTLLVCFAGLTLWWSGTYWKYVQRITERAFPRSLSSHSSTTGENVVNRETYMIKAADPRDIPMNQWVYTSLKSFDKIYMPKSTADGIHRILAMPEVRSGKKLKVLNMSELTPLAVEMPYELEKGERYPLWFHLGVGMFNREAKMFEDRIATGYYDIIIFEHIETLNNFYPFRIREALKKYYKITDSFLAPRRGDTVGEIEVYTH